VLVLLSQCPSTSSRSRGSPLNLNLAVLPICASQLPLIRKKNIHSWIRYRYFIILTVYKNYAAHIKTKQFPALSFSLFMRRETYAIENLIAIFIHNFYIRDLNLEISILGIEVLIFRYRTFNIKGLTRDENLNCDLPDTCSFAFFTASISTQGLYMTGCVEEEKERKGKGEGGEKAWIIRASSNRRPSQTSPFTFAYSTSLQPPTAEDQKERISKLFHLRFHLPFLSGKSASFLLSWLYTRCLKNAALILDKLWGSSKSLCGEN